MAAIFEKLQEIGRGFENMKERLDEIKKKTEERLEGLQHEMQQSSLAVEAGANGEKTGEREKDAVMNGRDGDTSFTNKGQRLQANAPKELLFSNNQEQGHLALSKTGSPSRRQTTVLSNILLCPAGGEGISSQLDMNLRREATSTRCNSLTHPKISCQQPQKLFAEGTAWGYDS